MPEDLRAAPPRRPRPLRMAAGALAAAVLGLAAVGSLAKGVGHEPPGSAPAALLPSSTSGPTGASGGSNAAAASLASQAAEVLAARGSAVVHRDLVAYLATADRGSVASARGAFARISALPWSRWDYRVVSVRERPAAASTRSSVASARRVIEVGVLLATRLAGLDTADAIDAEQVVLSQGPRGWQVQLERTTGARAALWEVGAVRVARGTHSLVIGVGALPAATLRTYAVATEAAVRAVASTWGQGWRGPVVVVVPATTDQAARLLGRPRADLAQIAAVATDEASGAAGGADRVWVNRPVMRGLTPTGRAVVLRHELLHVAAGAASSPAAPLWLEEGLAEYVGYRGSGLPVGVVAADVVAGLENGWRPSGLPGDEEFAATDPQLARTYEQSWLLARMVAARWGAGRLLELYRATSAGALPDAEANADTAVRHVLGLSRAALVARWQAYLREVAGSAGSSPA